MRLAWSKALAAGAVALALLVTSARPSRAQGAQGTITGQVTVQGTNEPLAEARVILVNTSLFTTTTAEGKYTLRNVPEGSHVVRVLRVGYIEQKKPATVAAGQTATVDFSMVQAVIKLTEVVTTATGE